MAVLSGDLEYDGWGRAGSSGEEQAHDAVEAHAPELDEEVDGVAGLAGGGADPVVVTDRANRVRGNEVKGQRLDFEDRRVLRVPMAVPSAVWVTGPPWRSNAQSLPGPP